jgi:hypothetical protein
MTETAGRLGGQVQDHGISYLVSFDGQDRQPNSPEFGAGCPNSSEFGDDLLPALVVKVHEDVSPDSHPTKDNISCRSRDEGLTSLPV